MARALHLQVNLEPDGIAGAASLFQLLQNTFLQGSLPTAEEPQQRGRPEDRPQTMLLASRGRASQNNAALSKQALRTPMKTAPGPAKLTDSEAQNSSKILQTLHRPRESCCDAFGPMKKARTKERLSLACNGSLDDSAPSFIQHSKKGYNKSSRLANVKALTALGASASAESTLARRTSFSDPAKAASKESLAQSGVALNLWELAQSVTLPVILEFKAESIQLEGSSLNFTVEELHVNAGFE